MEKARGWMVKNLERAGSSAFRLLSGFEGRKRLFPVISWLKLGLLGLILTLISACSRKPESVRTCYIPVKATTTISNVSISPNPTQGADSVKIDATARVFRPEIEGNHITGATVSLDDMEIPLEPLDGKYSNPFEELQAYLDVSGLKPGTTLVYLNANSSDDAPGMSYHYLIITDEPSEEE
ncbi:hypothetical protein JXM67_12670 [candidate division WOR-3 bacterium]|nr:hypothetical protein [candidate division WOR-3 bacterium]